MRRVLRPLSPSLSLVAWESSRTGNGQWGGGVFPLRAQELKPNLSQDVILSLPAVRNLWLLVSFWLLFSAASGVHFVQVSEGYIRRKINKISRAVVL